MTDRDDSGQFAAAEPLTGREGVEAEAGYKTMDAFEGKGDGIEFDDPQEAADWLTIHRDETPDPETRRYINTKTGEPLDNVTITPERGADDLTRIRNQELSSAIAADSFRDEIDAMRAEEAIKEDPEAKVETEAKEGPQEAKPAKETPAEPVADGELDHEVARALKLPQVAQAIEQEWTRADGVRQQYATALDTANRMSQLALVDALPELGNVPVQQWEAALQVLHSQDPQRVQGAIGLIQRAGQLQAAQQQQAQQQAYVAHQQFEATVTAEDARLTEMFGGDKAAAAAANDATISYLSEHGIPRQQILQVLKANPVLSTADARMTIWKAAKYDALQKSPAKAAPRDVPRVQRPGTSQPQRPAAGTSALAAFDKDPSIETGWRVLAARRKG